MSRDSLMFLSWEVPCPHLGGGTLRALGLLQELSKAFEVKLLVLARQPLSEEQTTVLGRYAEAIVQVPMRVAALHEKVGIAARIVWQRIPYHCALLRQSFQSQREALVRLRTFPGVVYCILPHWGTLVSPRRSPNWILDEGAGVVDYWRVYASQSSSRLVKLACLVNGHVAARYFSRVYASVGRVVSVCEEDRILARALAPQVEADVIENGVDCAFYVPNRRPRQGPPRLLFTGTSTAWNLTALRQFVRQVLPRICDEVPGVQLTVAGNFSSAAQSQFRGCSNLRFTGRLDDMRPVFDDSDVFVAPFEETHGSKLKVAEAMAMAIPIVSTPQGIRGFGLRDADSVLLARTPEQFAACVVALLRDAQRCDCLGAAARALALRTIDWSVLGPRLISLVEATQNRCMADRDRLPSGGGQTGA